jgi:phage terminase large subunit-like protein
VHRVPAPVGPKWPQALLKLVEDKANGPAVIASLGRMVPGIVPEEPHGSKEARAAAVSPLVEAGNASARAVEADVEPARVGR